MALIKEVNWKYGNTVKYWMITQKCEDKLTEKTSSVICGYISKARRMADIKEICLTKTIKLDGMNLTSEYIYNQFKLEPFFESSIDDL